MPIKQNAQGVWTNLNTGDTGPSDLEKAIQAQTVMNPSSVDPKDALLAGAKQTLAATQPEQNRLNTIEGPMPDAQALKATHPGVYDHIPDDTLQRALTIKHIQENGPQAPTDPIGRLFAAAGEHPYATAAMALPAAAMLLPEGALGGAAALALRAAPAIGGAVEGWQRGGTITPAGPLGAMERGIEGEIGARTLGGLGKLAGGKLGMLAKLLGLGKKIAPEAEAVTSEAGGFVGGASAKGAPMARGHYDPWEPSVAREPNPQFEKAPHGSYTPAEINREAATTSRTVPTNENMRDVYQNPGMDVEQKHAWSGNPGDSPVQRLANRMGVRLTEPPDFEFEGEAVQPGEPYPPTSAGGSIPPPVGTTTHPTPPVGGSKFPNIRATVGPDLLEALKASLKARGVQ